jgi:hypothetical protein
MNTTRGSLLFWRAESVDNQWQQPCCLQLGTFRTCLDSLTMSAHRGKARRKAAISDFDTSRTLALARQWRTRALWGAVQQPSAENVSCIIEMVPIC